MPIIRIPKEHWETIWETLGQVGPIHRVSKDYLYVVSEKHIEILKEKNLPFVLVKELDMSFLSTRARMKTMISRNGRMEGKERKEAGRRTCCLACS